jgi:hypothetical protein
MVTMSNEAWDLWVDFHWVDAKGRTHASLKDTRRGVRIEPGACLVVGDHDAEPAVAEVVKIEANDVVLLRVLPGSADAHRDLVSNTRSR